MLNSHIKFWNIQILCVSLHRETSVTDLNAHGHTIDRKGFLANTINRMNPY